MGPKRNWEHWEQGILQLICVLILRVTGSTETEEGLKGSTGKAHRPSASVGDTTEEDCNGLYLLKVACKPLDRGVIVVAHCIL